MIFLSYTGRSTCSISTYTGIFNAIYFGMKPLPKLLLALTAVAAVSVAYPAKANLITNGGFEDGQIVSGSWSTEFHIGLANVSAQNAFNGIAPHSGNFQAVLQLPNSSAGFSALFVPTTPGTTYTIHFFAATSNLAGPVTLIVGFTGASFSHVFTANTGYTEFTFNATVPDSLSTLTFIGSGQGNLHLDDISVEPAGVGVPDGGTTVSLLGCALLGLAGLRRKLGC